MKVTALGNSYIFYVLQKNHICCLTRQLDSNEVEVLQPVKRVASRNLDLGRHVAAVLWVNRDGQTGYADIPSHFNTDPVLGKKRKKNHKIFQTMRIT